MCSSVLQNHPSPLPHAADGSRPWPRTAERSFLPAVVLVS